MVIYYRSSLLRAVANLRCSFDGQISELESGIHIANSMFIG